MLTVALLVVGIGGFQMWHDGYRAYIVHTGSMTPTYKPGDLVIDRPAGAPYHPGQVITFRHSNLTTDVVTHRVTAVVDGRIHTKGDANRTPDVWEIRPDQVRGTVMAHVPYAGYVAVYFEQPTGVASLVAILFGLVLLWDLSFRPAGPVPAAPASGEDDLSPASADLV